MYVAALDFNDSRVTDGQMLKLWMMQLVRHLEDAVHFERPYLELTLNFNMLKMLEIVEEETSNL